MILSQNFQAVLASMQPLGSYLFLMNCGPHSDNSTGLHKANQFIVSKAKMSFFKVLLKVYFILYLMKFKYVPLPTQHFLMIN